MATILSDSWRSTPDTYLDEKAAVRVVNFFEQMLCHSKGEQAGKPFILLPWQRRMLTDLYGTYNKKTRARQYRTAYIEIPKKQGKSTTLAGLALYSIVADGEPGAEAYGAASDREQAGIIYREAAAMVQSSPALSRHLEVINSRKTILHRGTNSFYRVLSADGFRAEGLNIHALLFDELHAQRDRRLWDALRYGGAARRQPLLLSITTAGYDRRSICWEQHVYAEKCLADPEFDPSFYPMIFAAPQDCGNDDSWKNPEVWHQANPSLGKTISLDSFAADAREADRSPSKLSSFLRYRLCVWTTTDVRWIKPETWQLGSQPLRPFGDRPVFAGMDLATTYDLSALVLVCPDPEDNSIDVLPFFWIPEANAVERINRDRVPYDQWIRDGFLRTTEGNTTDYTILHRDVTEICQKYGVRQLGVDIRFNAQMLANMLQGEGVDVRGFAQGGRVMSAPARALENLIQGGKVRHDNHPVLAWCANNCAVAEDRYGNIYPSKARSTERIDGVVALCQAIGCWITSDTTPSQQSQPEILIL